MKKYFVLILSLVLITACKNTTTDSTNSTDTNTPPKPTTLADRAGTYKATSNSHGRSLFIIVNKDGTGIFIAGEGSNADAPINIIIGEPTSTNTSFNFSTRSNVNWTIDFKENTLQSPQADYGSALFIISKQS